MCTVREQRALFLVLSLCQLNLVISVTSEENLRMKSQLSLSLLSDIAVKFIPKLGINLRDKIFRGPKRDLANTFVSGYS